MTALISVVFFFAVPRFQGAVLTDDKDAVSRRLLGTIQSLREGAVGNQKRYTLHVDLDNAKLWVSDESMVEETLKDAEDRGFALPSDVKVMDVEYPDKGKIVFGRANISFYKQGYSDTAFIHIEDGNNGYRSFLIETFLTKVKLYEEYVTFED